MKFFAVILLLTARQLFPQQVFTNHCAACHGEDARGTAQGPGLAMNPRVAEQSADQLRAYLERGNPGAGMPSFAGLPGEDLATLARYLRRINADTILKYFNVALIESVFLMVAKGSVAGSFVA